MKYAEPDLIIVTGDLIYPDLKTTHSPDNMKSFTLLCDFFENMGVPWTFTFGNHDTEGFALAGPEDINHVTQTYLKCLYQYRDPLGGRTNLFINVRDKENMILQSLVLMDSREYVVCIRRNPRKSDIIMEELVRKMRRYAVPKKTIPYWINYLNWEVQKPYSSDMII